MSDELEVTPTHLIKPHLQWFGKILGCDVYIDTASDHHRDMAERVLNKALDKLASADETH